MLHNKLISALIIGFLIIFSGKLYTQTEEGKVTFKEKNLGGPRLGVTYVLGNGEAYHTLKDNKMDRAISQFGWHFEYQITPNIANAPKFVIQFIPLIGGVEYGKVVPSTTLAFGIRFSNGIEFGMGPNILVTTKGPSTSLVLAAGKSFDYGGVNIPLNIAYVLNPKGNRISFIFGYAID